MVCEYYENGLIARNRRAIYRVVKDSFTHWNGDCKPEIIRDFNGSQQHALVARSEGSPGAD